MQQHCGTQLWTLRWEYTQRHQQHDFPVLMKFDKVLSVEVRGGSRGQTVRESDL